MIVHPAYLMLSSATLSNEIFCCSFLIKILFFFLSQPLPIFTVTDLTGVAIFDIIDWDVFEPVHKQEAHSSKRDIMVTQIMYKEATNRREGKQKRSLS